MTFFQPFLERRGDWTYCALAIRNLCPDDAGNYSVTVTNKYFFSFFCGELV